jgi:phytoene synthase
VTSGAALGRAELVAAARDTIAKGSQSFASASKLFDPETRERAWLLYSWCRAADDMTDGQELGHPAACPAQGMDRQAELEVLTANALSRDDPLPAPFAALRQVARETGLPRRFVDDHLAGFALDTAGWRPDSGDDLLRYCYHVAGVVGCMMAVVMGVDPDDAETLDRACDQGIAFQLANIARDIVPDAEAGRCYIPAQWLAELGLSEEGLAAPANRAALATIAARMVALAEPYRASARIGAGHLSVRSRLAVLAADAIYGAIGERVVLLGAQAWDRRVRIGRAGKAGQLVKAAMRSLARPAVTQRAGLWTRPR